MYKNILIPVEVGDPDAYRTAKQAAMELLDDDGKITLFHAIEPVPTYIEAHIPPDFRIQSRNEVKTLLAEMSSELEIDEPELVFGSAGRNIVEWADQNSVDCIVIASHKPQFSDIFLGSTAAWVVRHAMTNVLVLR